MIINAHTLNHINRHTQPLSTYKDQKARIENRTHTRNKTNQKKFNDKKV